MSTPTNFNGFRVLPSLLQRHRSSETSQTLHDVWPSPGLLYFRRLLPPDRIMPGVKFTLRPSLAFSYIRSVTARHSSSRRQPNFVACYKEWNYRTFCIERHLYSEGRPLRWAAITLAIGPHSRYYYYGTCPTTSYVAYVYRSPDKKSRPCPTRWRTVVSAADSQQSQASVTTT